MKCLSVRLLQVAGALVCLAVVCVGQQTALQLGAKDIASLAVTGRTISAEEANRLEQLLQKDPADIASRFTLISYYSGKFRDKEMVAKKCGHVLWTIENASGSPSLHYFSWIRLHKQEKCYLNGKEAWLKQVESNTKNLDVLRNAIDFFLISDKVIAERLIRQGAAIEPQSPEWVRKLGRMYSLQMSAAKGDQRVQLAKSAFEQFEQAFKLMADAERRNLRMELALTAFEARETSKAEAFANQLLTEPSDAFPGARSDSFHSGHMILGRVALQKGDLAEAKRQLIEAGKVDGSPVLNSFGPGMLLAKELLEKGERDVVLDYFSLVVVFWKNEKLLNWVATVRGGDTPDFGANAYR